MNEQEFLNRRQFLGQMGCGLGSIALACMLAEESHANVPLQYPAKA